MTAEKRGSWNDRAGFLLAAIGSAVGLGNIWRFPYVAYKNGGGAFLIPYAVALFVVGVPLLIAEQGLGHHFRASAPLAFSRIRKSCEWLGWWPVLMVTFGILLYYTVILGWCLNYLVFSFSLGWGADTESFFFNKFLGITSGPFDFGNFHGAILIGTFLVWVMIWAISVRGVKRGLELANRICIPLLALLMLIMFVWSLFIRGSTDGMLAFLTPDISRLSDPAVWRDAFGQVFFSLSLAMGIMIAYASYLGRKTPIVNNSWIAALADSGFAIFAGLVVFATLGTMAHAEGVPVDEVVKSGPGLAFVIYPKAINLLPFGSRIFGAFFFLALLFAGITSAISILESFICSAIDKLGKSRTKVVTISCVIGFLGSLVFTCGGGLYLLDIVDYFLTNFGLLMVGLLEALVIGWMLGAKKMSDYVNESSGIRIGRWWSLPLKFGIPIVLVILLATAVFDNLEKPYGGYSWIALAVVGIGWFVMTFLAAIVFTRRKWVDKA